MTAMAFPAQAAAERLEFSIEGITVLMSGDELEDLEAELLWMIGFLSQSQREFWTEG